MNLSSFLQSDQSNDPHYLLIGNPVGHSLSPFMHNLALSDLGIKAQYFAINLQENEWTKLAAHFNDDAFLGANITIPYKQLMMDYVDEIDQSAAEIGAINTVVKSDYRLKGFNTDIDGFLSPLREFQDELRGEGVIVFGSGGASRAIVAALNELQMKPVKLVSRSPARVNAFKNSGIDVISYDEWPAFSDDARLVVNATPLGMDPNVNQSPVRETEKQFLGDKICYDIVYNPLKTKFLKMAKEVGARPIGGLEMLIQQGSRSFELWTGKPFPVEMIRTKLHEKFED
ncbi:MAG TPA: shikimate dehydrogenase [Balneolaceae bacterium]|nr:shikimate dehydrogenase [Balneolaceae bacterium]